VLESITVTAVVSLAAGQKYRAIRVVNPLRSGA
jgi:hypothetical protein